MNKKNKIHTHRPIIGFDSNGVSKVLVPGHSHGEIETDDYMKAVALYRKTFPDHQKVMEEAPDPAVREMLKRAKQINFNTVFDRFDAQQPQCAFGLSGVCCKNCSMGPCKITPRSPKGVCGADEDLIVARNLLRSVAGGVAQHGMHAREMILMLKWAAMKKAEIPIIGKYKVLETAKALHIPVQHRQFKNITIDVCNRLLDDLSRSEPEPYEMIEVFASEERKKVWKELDILPISAYHEVFEAMHKTGCGVDGDWESVMKQFLRCGLAFTYSSVVGTAIATDSLLGVGDRTTSKVNVGALKEGFVNIAVHGHLPVLVREIVRIGHSKEYIDLAKKAGAKGIQFYGICCSALSAMYRYEGVIPLSNAISAELVLGTGALDLWMADVQDVFPSIMDVAHCFQTTVITTSDSTRLPGAEHIGYDHHHSNIEQTQEIAAKIVKRAIESFEARKGIPVFIPPYEVEAEVGFSVEYIYKRFGSFEPIAQAIKEGKILGIVNLVGCTNPKVMYEKAILDVCDVLLKNNILVLTNGCASFPLMKMGYCQCSESAYAHCGESLKEFLHPDLPPVWHVGECIDNGRSSAIFAGLAEIFGKPLYEMPFSFASPEWANEKGVGAALGFRLQGINTYHCIEPPIHGSKNVIHFLKEGTKNTLNSVMVVEADPVVLANKIVSDIKEKRAKLGI